MQTAHCARMRSKTGYAEFGYFDCYLKMDAPRALVFLPLVKGNEALGTRLPQTLTPPSLDNMVGRSFQNYDRVYAGFSSAYTRLYTLRMEFKPFSLCITHF